MNSPSQLPRVLGAWMATALVIGTVIGSGVFKKASSVSAGVPEFGMVMVAWIVVGILTLMGALALAEVAVLLPRAGGNYVFLKESYGPWAGYLWGWVEFWIIRSGSIAALATVFSESVHDLMRQANDTQGDVLEFWERVAMTVTVIGVLALINARGTRWGGGLQVLVTTVKAATLILVALLPFIILAAVSEPRTVPTTAFVATNTWPTSWGDFGWSAFGGALIGIFFAYHGWMNVAPVAEEVKNPGRNLPIALFVGCVTVIILYVSANLAYYLVIPREEIVALKNRTVVGEFALRLLGPVGLVLASTAVMISVFGALNGNLLAGPRLLFAMGRDRMVPASLAALHPRYQTPARAAVVLAGWSILLVIIVGLLIRYRLPVFDLGLLKLDLNLPAGKAPFDVVTDFAMFGALSFETLAVASIFVLRRTHPPERVILPYRCPLYPWLPIVYCAAMTVVLLNMFVTQRAESLFGLGFMVVGAFVYVLWVRRSMRLQ